jgi:hypothetical protein
MTALKIVAAIAIGSALGVDVIRRVPFEHDQRRLAYSICNVAYGARDRYCPPLRDKARLVYE